MTCNGKCSAIENVISYRTGRKKPEFKVCISCEKAFPYEGIWCPCCGSRVRHKARRPMQYEGFRY